MQKDARIVIVENGPYRVYGDVPLTRRYPLYSAAGEPLEWEPVTGDPLVAPPGEYYELCRCGRSARMPFCDQSHEKAPFDSALHADRRPTAERRRLIQGVGVTMTDDYTFCTSAGFCGTTLTTVWKMIKHTQDPEVRQRLLRMVANCPSGRLEASLDGQPVEPEYIPSIAATPDGPLWVRGGIPIHAPDGFVYEVRNRVTLCRCGGSKNKPFCDASHTDNGFKAP